MDPNPEGDRPRPPVLCVLVPGATHAPHHPKKEWVEKYKGKFDHGWDRVRRRRSRPETARRGPAGGQADPAPKGVPAWDSLTAAEKTVYARMMELYAAYMEQTDFNVGRVLEAVERVGQRDNTLVMYIVGDNGASAEGSMQGLLNEMTFFNHVPEDLKQVLGRVDDLGTWKTYNHYPVGWAHAMCTPFQWTKQVASHYGGTRNGMVVSWPARIKDRGGCAMQWHHVIDVVPTLLDAAGVVGPTR